MRVAQPSISQTFFKLLLITALTIASLLGAAWFTEHYFDYRRSLEQLHDQVYNADRAVLEHEVQKVLEYVAYMQSLTQERLRSDIRARVEEAVGIANTLYQTNRSQMSDEQIKRQIVETLRSIRFNNGRGYYFVTELTGVEVLFADHPELEGQNLWDWQDTNGKYVIREMSEIVTREGAGFIEYTWTKPGAAGHDHRKIAYVQHFKPFGWMIGTGEYRDDVDQDIQQETIARIEQIKFGQDGYIFAGTNEGVSLSGPAKGQNMRDVADVHGVKIVQELIQAAQNGGGFVEYVMPPFEGVKPEPKLSYAAAIPEWDWYVGAGKYINDVEQALALRQQSYRRHALTHLTGLGLFLLVVLVVIWLINALAVRRAIGSGLQRFTDFFASAGSQQAYLDPAAQPFSELSLLAQSANQMIAQRTIAEAALRASEERIRAILNNALSGIFIADSQGRIEDCNQQFADLTGYPQQELMGRLMSSLTPPADWEREDQLIHSMINDQARGVRYEKEYIRAGGESVPVEVSVSAIREQDGTVKAVVGVVNDIRERHSAERERLVLEEQLRQAHKMEAIGVLAGGIAHDFNNVLFAILGNADLGLETVGADHPAAEFFAEITTASHRAVDLVRQILTFARQRANQRLELDLLPLVKEVAKLMRAALPANIEVVQRISETSLVVVGDPTEVHQVLMNLCTNAGQAMLGLEGAGRLELRLDRITLDASNAAAYINLQPGQYARISISDTGPGIASEVLPRIFEPFFTTKNVGEGTGMGLAVVHGIVSELGGTIKVTTAAGQGTAFEVLLPLTEVTIRPDELSPVALPQGTERLIVVDDEPAICEMVATILRTQGFQVDAFTDSVAALAAMQEQPGRWDGLVVDQAMPKLTGGELVRAVRALRPELPIVLCTGYSQSMTEAKARDMGVSEYLFKPLSRRDLVTAVRRALDNQAQEPSGN